MPFSSYFQIQARRPVTQRESSRFFPFSESAKMYSRRFLKPCPHPAEFSLARETFQRKGFPGARASLVICNKSHVFASGDTAVFLLGSKNLLYSQLVSLPGKRALMLSAAGLSAELPVSGKCQMLDRSAKHCYQDASMIQIVINKLSQSFLTDIPRIGTTCRCHQKRK